MKHRTGRMRGIAATALLLAALVVGTATAAEKLPNIVILATGGTIAGSAESNTDMTGYTSGTVGVQILIDAVPEMKRFANVTGEQISNIGSEHMTYEVWLKLAKRCNELLSSPDVAGIVITHGTDTMEETSYFLNLVVKSEKPIVLVGAMRPSTALSADGPVNILNGVRLAASKDAMGRGVMIALNDEINGSRDVTKTNTATVSTFKAPELGLLGYFIDGEPVFYRATTRKHTVKSEFSVADGDSLPKVAIVYGTAGMTADLVEAYASLKDIKGIVYAGVGMGNIHEAALPALQAAKAKGITVVQCSRVGNGIVPHGDFISAGNLNPQKAKVLLHLALLKTSDAAEIQRMYDEY